MAIIALYLYKHFALIRLRKFLLDNNNRDACSLAWAWASETEILALQNYWGGHVFGDISDFRRPFFERAVLPHKILILISVILYQNFGRFGPAFAAGDCPSTPNCSNYLIGCLSRYGLVTALAKSHIRVNCCTGGETPNFRENFV
jgi:putative component of membrane protein insertase Oxa1/YidC/SpoIIIJ protein YidD